MVKEKPESLKIQSFRVFLLLYFASLGSVTQNTLALFCIIFIHCNNNDQHFVHNDHIRTHRRVFNLSLMLGELTRGKRTGVILFHGFFLEFFPVLICDIDSFEHIIHGNNSIKADSGH